MLTKTYLLYFENFLYKILYDFDLKLYMQALHYVYFCLKSGKCVKTIIPNPHANPVTSKKTTKSNAIPLAPYASTRVNQ